MQEDGDEVILEGAWNCAQCRQKGIRGHLLHCPNCGDARDPLVDPSEAPYLPHDARVVTDPEELKQARSGPDWNCGNCGEENPGTSKVCSSCGEALGNNDDVQPVITYVSGAAADGVDLDDPANAGQDWTDTVLKQSDPLQALEDGPVSMPDRTYLGDAPHHGIEGPLYSPDREADPKTLRPQQKSRSFAVVSGLLVFVLAAIGIGYWYYSDNVATHQVSLEVQGMSWERQIGIDADKTFTQSGWSVPSNGHVISSHLAIRSYVKVLDHYVTKTRQVGVQVKTGTTTKSTACGTTKVSLGNGNYSSKTKYCKSTVPTYKTVYHSQQYKVAVYRQQPVYATRYTYWYTQWVLDHYVTASGTTNPYWPTPDNKGPLQRVGGERTQSYTVILVESNGAIHNEPIAEGTWSQLRRGEKLQGAETHNGNLRSVTWPTS